MQILIDGYNLLKFMYKVSYIKQGQLYAFYQQLTKYSKQQQHYIELVLDGGNNINSMHENRAWGIIVYAGYSSTADKYIKNRLEELALQNKLDEYNIVVVSGDREVCGYAHYYSIVCIPPKLFYQKMTSHLAVESSPIYNKVQFTPGKAHKYTIDNDNSYLDALMQQGSLFMYNKDDAAQKLQAQKTQAEDEVSLVKLDKKVKNLLKNKRVKKIVNKL